MIRNRIIVLFSIIAAALTTGSLLPAEPGDLSVLRESYQRARRAALEPVEKKYLDALSDMKVRYTKVGDLEAALAVDAEIKSLQFAVDNAERSKAAEPGDDSMVVLETSGSNRLRFVKGPFTRKEAEALASSMGGKLATVRSSKEMKEISDAMAKNFGNDFPHSWLGLARTPGGEWIWPDGSVPSEALTIEYGDSSKYPKNNGAIIRFGKITATDPLRTSPGAIIELKP